MLAGFNSNAVKTTLRSLRYFKMILHLLQKSLLISLSLCHIQQRVLRMALQVKVSHSNWQVVSSDSLGIWVGLVTHFLYDGPPTGQISNNSVINIKKNTQKYVSKFMQNNLKNPMIVNVTKKRFLQQVQKIELIN